MTNICKDSLTELTWEMTGEHQRGKDSKRLLNLVTICPTRHYDLLWEITIKEVSTCACPKTVKAGQELCKVPRVSRSFKIKCLDSAPSPHPLQKAFQKCYKVFIFMGWREGQGGQDTEVDTAYNITTYICITRTRTRSLHFKQKNLRASRAGRTKSTSLPLFLVSLADRPILPANSTIF